MAPKAAKPEWCASTEVSKLAETVCNVCADGYQCGGHNLDQDECDPANRLNSRAGEMSCYPYRFTYPTGAGYDAPTNTYTPVTSWTDDKIVHEVHPGEYNFDGGILDSDYDCPVGYQCIWPFM